MECHNPGFARDFARSPPAHPILPVLRSRERSSLQNRIGRVCTKGTPPGNIPGGEPSGLPQRYKDRPWPTAIVVSAPHQEVSYGGGAGSIPHSSRRGRGGNGNRPGGSRGPVAPEFLMKTKGAPNRATGSRSDGA